MIDKAYEEFDKMKKQDYERLKQFCDCSTILCIFFTTIGN